jgi:GT2 family glycosyltransferase
MPSVSVVVVAWGPSPLLGSCVDAVLDSRGVNVDVIVVDNGCDDGAVDAIERVGDSRVQVIRPDINLGFAGGCNLGARSASGTIVAFVNPDAVVGPGALAAMSRALEDADIGIVTSRLRLLREPDLLNSSGGSLHFLGIGWADGFRQPASSETRQRPVTNASGAGMAMRLEQFRQFDGFASELFLYHEDCELSVRVWLSGLRVDLVPDADVWHDYHFSKSSSKYYYLERNRLIIVLSVYEVKTLLLLSPALLLLELGMLLLAAREGWFREKARGWIWLVEHRHWVAEHRRQIQSSRVLRDRDLAPLLSARFDAGQIQMSRVFGVIDDILGRYWRFTSAYL